MSLPMEQAPRSLRACRIRRRVGSATACSIRFRVCSGSDMVKIAINRGSMVVNVGNGISFADGRGRRRSNVQMRLPFQDWIVAVADQLAAHQFGIFDVRIRPDLHVNKLISRAYWLRMRDTVFS